MALSLCGGIAANTGGIDCDSSPGIIRKIIVWGGSLDSAEYDTPETVQAAFELAAGLPKADANKMFVFPIAQEITDNSEQNTTGSLGLGFTAVVREGKPAYSLKVFAGQSLVSQLRKFNNTTIRILTLDANGKVWGVSSNGRFIGAQARLFTAGLKFATGQGIEEGVVTISVSFLDTNEINSNAAFVELADDSGVEGLNDVNLSEYAPHSSNVMKMQLIVPTAEMGGGINLQDTYGTELASIGAWKASSGGTPITITAVTENTANNGWDVTLDSTEYTALPAQAKIIMDLVAPAVLDATYNVVGIEAVPLTIIK